MRSIAKRLRRSMMPVFFTLCCLVGFLCPASVLAIDDPDTPPSVNAVYVYDFDDGSVGVLIDYYLDYASLPDETSTESYLAVFLDTDGTTQLKAVSPYTFVDSGYGRGLIWIMFTDAEAETYGLSSADKELYRVWLVGNPALSWSGDPPKTEATIDQWNTTGDMNVLLSLRVLYYADILELAWELDMVEVTSVGNRLTTVGESYFENVIADCRTLAPSAFSGSTDSPDYISISYNTAFGATVTSGTATVDGSPVTLTDGSNTIDTGVTTGTVIIDLAQWTGGTITDATGTVTGSPVSLYPGVNTVTVTGAGTFTVAVTVTDSSTVYGGTVTGTGLDMTGLATVLGMSRWMVSGIIWIFITVLICGGSFAASAHNNPYGGNEGASKTVMVLATVCLIGGTLLGLLHPIVSCMLFIGFGAVIGYVLFFRGDSLHKGMMFMVWMFLITSIAGNVAASGVSGISTTRLTAALSDSEVTSISVASTKGFPDAGIILIGDEQLTYPRKDATHFLGTAVVNPIIRGSGSTTAVTHAVNDAVRTKESWVLNASIDYKIARLVDSAGAMGFIAAPVRLFDLLLTFFKLPLDFLGTDLAVLSYVWMVVAIGMIVGFIVTLAGGRRV